MIPRPPLLLTRIDWTEVRRHAYAYIDGSMTELQTNDWCHFFADGNAKASFIFLE